MVVKLSPFGGEKLWKNGDICLKNMLKCWNLKTVIIKISSNLAYRTSKNLAFNKLGL